jgi:predicted phosphodiesterase
VRLGVIADIHGNLLALDAVLAVFERLDVADIVCLGDVAALGPEPRGVVRRLRERGISSVRGNTDAWNLDAALLDRESTSDVTKAIVRWNTAQLEPDDLDWLRDQPLTRSIALGAGVDLVAFHGSPRSCNEVLSATTPAGDLDELFPGDAAIYAGGHTHIQLLRRHAGYRLLNPGSVGFPGVGPGTTDLPVNDGVAWAEFAVIDTTDGLSIDLRRLPLDIDALRASVRDSSMPHADWWLSRWATPDSS